MQVPGLLHSLLRRHAALQLSFGQVHWDLLIPVYLGSPAEEFECENLSALLIQVKNRKSKPRLLLGREFPTYFTDSRVGF